MRFRFRTLSFLLIHSWSSEFGFLFCPLVYLRVWKNNLILECFLKSSSACLSQQSSIFKIHTSVHVQLSPMALRSARREALSQPPIGQPLQYRVNPTETKSFFHNLNVWYSWPLWTFTAICHHPTTFLFAMVLFEPLPKFGAIPKVEKINYFHGTISIRLY